MSDDLSVEQNPYASPAITETLAVVPGEYELIDQRIVGPSPIVLPEVCVRCGENAETGKRLKKTIAWIPLWSYVLIFVHPIIFLIVVLLMYKKGKVEYSLCEACNGHRWMRIKICWLLAGMTSVCSIYFIALVYSTIYSIQAISMERLIPSGIGMSVLFFSTLISKFFADYPIRAKNYQKPVFYLGGAKTAFFEAMAKRKPSSEPAILAEESS